MLLLKSFWNRFNRHQESGIALIQVLMMSVLLAGAVSFSVLQNSKTTQKVAHDIYTQDLRQFVSRVQDVLANQSDCTDIIGGTTGFSTLATGNTITPTELTGDSAELQKFLEVTNIGTMSPRYGAQEKISLTSMSIERTTDTAATLTLNFTIDDTKVLGIREFAKTIPLVIDGTPTTITTCHANPDDMISSAVKRFCQGPGAIYDPETQKCLLIGFNDEDCDPGYYMKGLTYDASTMLVTPICEEVAGLTYDEVGCVGKAGVPIGFDASGNIVCEKMTSGYIWDFVYNDQKNAATRECSSRITKLDVMGDDLMVRCMVPTPTYTPTPTPTDYTASTPSNTPTSPTGTPTYTATASTPTPTPTELAYCSYTGNPTSALSSFNEPWAAPGTILGSATTYIGSNDFSADYYTGLSCLNVARPADEFLISLEPEHGMAGVNTKLAAWALVFQDVSSNQCRMAIVTNTWLYNYSNTHAHSHHVGFSHKHCVVDVYSEIPNYVSPTSDLGHATAPNGFCDDNVSNPSAGWQFKIAVNYSSEAGTDGSPSCLPYANTNFYYCSYGNHCYTSDFRGDINDISLYFCRSAGSCDLIGYLDLATIVNYCGGLPASIWIEKLSAF